MQAASALRFSGRSALFTSSARQTAAAGTKRRMQPSRRNLYQFSRPAAANDVKSSSLSDLLPLAVLSSVVAANVATSDYFVNKPSSSDLLHPLAAFSSLLAAAITACEKEPTEEELEQEWDTFLAKSIVPGEDDDDDDDDEDEDDEDEAETEETGDGEEEEEQQQEEEVAPLPTGEDASETEPTEEVDDPYDNLTEDDEPTHCSICQINREGPCRPLWRKFEKCMKDHSNRQSEKAAVASTNGESESEDTKTPSLGESCDKYMLPWIGCFQENKEVYTLLTNRFYQYEMLDDAEAAVEEKDKLCWSKDPDINWSPWVQYLEENKVTVTKLFLGYFQAEQRQVFLDNYRKEMEERGVKPKRVWYDAETPPVVDCQARVALQDSETNLPIEVAYARDQDGKVLGFEMFSNDKREGKKESLLNFSVHMADTKSVKICAIYQEEEKAAAPQEDTKESDSKVQDAATTAQEPKLLQKRLYFSKPISLLQPMAEAELVGKDADASQLTEEALMKQVMDLREKITKPPQPSDETNIEKTANDKH